MLYEFAGLNLKDKFAPVWERAPEGGLALGSLGAFLVLEEQRPRAGARRQAARAADPVLSDRNRRRAGAATAALRAMWDKLPPRAPAAWRSSPARPARSPRPPRSARSSPSTPDVPVRATGSYIGHGFEPQFPMNVALAAIAVNRGSLFPPGDGSGVERAMDGPLSQVVVTSVGHWRGEGLALVEAAT